MRRERVAGGWRGAFQFVAFVRYNLGDQITEDEVVEHVACTEWVSREHPVLIGKL